MSRNGSGSYSLPGATNPVVTGTSISSTWANTTLSDVATEITNSVAVDGQSVMSGTLKLKDGTNSSPAWAFGSESTMGCYRKSAGVIGISVAGVEKYTISATALTLPADPSSALHAATKQYVDAAIRSFQNKLINGNFDFWQRGTSLSAAAAARYLADRWLSSGVGSTVAPSQQAFTLGQTGVPSEPVSYHRCVVASSAGAGNYAQQYQRIESVRTLAGKTATLSFWAKADAAKNIAIEPAQVFGSGGSPSATVYASPTTCALTTAWQKFTVTVSLPSISGKTLGTAGDDCVQVAFWFDAGSSFNSRTNSLVQQSGTFDIAQVQLEEGSVATAFEQRPAQVELALCQRYYEKSFLSATTPVQNAGIGSSEETIGSPVGASTLFTWQIAYNVQKRAAPSVTLYNPQAANAQVRNESLGADCTGTTLTAIGAPTERRMVIQATTPASTAAGHALAIHWAADSEL